MSKFHEHDCSDCTYIGSARYKGEDVDVYESCENSADRFIVRYGPDGDYVTVGSYATDQYNFCMQLRVTTKINKNTLANLLNIREGVLTEREDTLEQLGRISMKLKSLNKEIEYWENKGVSPK